MENKQISMWPDKTNFQKQNILNSTLISGLIFTLPTLLQSLNQMNIFNAKYEKIPKEHFLTIKRSSSVFFSPP